MWKSFFGPDRRKTASHKLHDPENPCDGEFDPIASKADILSCFRIILGRKPNLEEWPGHSSRAGELLEDIVRTFVNSQQFKSRGLLNPEIPKNIVHADTGRFIIWANASDPVIGAPALAGRYEPHVAKVISDTLKQGDTFVDVGANIGYFSLLASSIVGSTGRVYSIEPNDLNVKLLEKSRSENGFEHLRVLQIGASEHIETLFLHAASGNGSTGALQSDQIFSSRTIPGIPLDLVLADRSSRIRLLKIDVEGFEYKALSGMRSILEADQPDLVIEFAPKGLQGIDGKGFLDWLAAQGYQFRIIPKNGTLGAVIAPEKVLDAWRSAGVDHIDILACSAGHK
ncbi:FkbM family methyltransferase [uncultured Marivita sp.]|uniref:FkbM family methyltransferase n=1 Tax=uncultured Marivita sp. TaxID=888080 RepID=UPI00260AC954|nr:FkbM family methyltransferase [uncultured Marivita sp.]